MRNWCGQRPDLPGWLLQPVLEAVGVRRGKGWRYGHRLGVRMSYGCILKDFSFIWLMVEPSSWWFQYVPIQSSKNKKKIWVIIHMFRISKLPEIPAILAGQLERKTKRGPPGRAIPQKNMRNIGDDHVISWKTWFHAFQLNSNGASVPNFVG